MSTQENIRENRIKKLKAIESAGFLAYPIKSKRTHSISQALDKFKDFSSDKKELYLVGRLRLMRVHGGATFVQIEDGTGLIQGFLSKNRLGENSYKFFLDNFDVGDFVELRGILFETKKGEKTIEAAGFNMLCKNLRPLPEKWHGLKEIEERYRKRYLDLIFNPEVREKFKLRTKIITEIRSFLDKKGFLEVETPILQPLYGGARAKPFKTHLNALNIDIYLRISLELYLKRLLVGGFEKVYEIGKCFRNEGVDRGHNPDFTMLEFYWSFADYKEMMVLTEEMLTSLLKAVIGKTTISYQGEKIDFKAPWPRIEFFDLIKKETKLDLQQLNRDALAKEAKALGVEFEKSAPKTEIADEVFKKFCRPKIVQPTFIIHYPLGTQPLSKALNDEKLANLQLVVAGWELINAFSELNDPLEQRKRFEEQERFYSSGFEEAQRLDEDFLEALEYGMPPAAGFGMGIDRLVSLLTDSYSLRDAMLFPTMKPK